MKLPAASDVRALPISSLERNPKAMTTRATTAGTSLQVEQIVKPDERAIDNGLDDIVRQAPKRRCPKQTQPHIFRWVKKGLTSGQRGLQSCEARRDAGGETMARDANNAQRRWNHCHQQVPEVGESTEGALGKIRDGVHVQMPVVSRDMHMHMFK